MTAFLEYAAFAAVYGLLLGLAALLILGAWWPLLGALGCAALAGAAA